MSYIYCRCERPLVDVDHDAGCRRCGLPVNFSPDGPNVSSPAGWERTSVGYRGWSDEPLNPGGFITIQRSPHDGDPAGGGSAGVLPAVAASLVAWCIVVAVIVKVIVGW